MTTFVTDSGKYMAFMQRGVSFVVPSVETISQRHGDGTWPGGHSIASTAANMTLIEEKILNLPRVENVQYGIDDDANAVESRPLRGREPRVALLLPTSEGPGVQGASQRSLTSR